ncbi:MAG TPA: diguanylate cyclase, partial [Rhodanobacteraceae bacterium]|nr:diguanylate cyclase [Rhodanobacteraceae bacterium]
MRRFLIGLVLAFAPLCSVAETAALSGAWRPAVSGETAAQARAGDPVLKTFDPARLTAFDGGENGSWVLLTPASGHWPAAPFVLEATTPGLQTFHLYRPNAAPERASMMQPADDAWPCHGCIAFPIGAAPAEGEPLVLHVDATGVIPSAMTFAVRTVGEYQRRDAMRLAIASACLATMLATAVIALFFGVRLRDIAFVYYSIFVLGYALIMTLQSGYVVDPLGWTLLAESPRVWGRLATAVSIVAAVLFLDRFAHLARHAPRWRRVLMGYAGAIAALTALSVVPLEAAHALGRALINPLLIVGGPVLLGTAIAAAWRGSRYAWFFLAGWTPLLAVTVLGSLQLYGIADGWTWSDDAALGAGALEALVLSLGLADRSLALRRDRDHARRLADIDALTGLYNRRGWTDRVLALDEELRRDGTSYSVLYLDLDRFKELNDRLGHEAGDAALRTLAAVMREELREQDIIGRFGGEEFVVALPGADRLHAARVAERIRARLQALAAADPAEAMRTVSIGAATLHEGETTAALLKRADAAMYSAKAAGR